MKVLIWYCEKFAIKDIQDSSRMNKIDENENLIDDNNVIVPWITIETKEDSNYFEDLLKELKLVKSIYNTNKVIILPFAHLSSIWC